MRMGPFAPKVHHALTLRRSGTNGKALQGTDKHFDKKDAIALLKDKYFYLFAVAYFSFANSLNATGCTSAIHSCRRLAAKLAF